MWGVLINGIQAAGLEHKGMRTASWNGENSALPRSFLSFVSKVLNQTVVVGLLVAYSAAMLILYTVAPLLYRMASSAYYNLSLLSSDFYGLLFGLFLFVRPFPSLALLA
jgi:solute carrier family 35, member F1/2